MSDQMIIAVEQAKALLALQRVKISGYYEDHLAYDRTLKALHKNIIQNAMLKEYESFVIEYDGYSYEVERVNDKVSFNPIK